MVLLLFTPSQTSLQLVPSGYLSSRQRETCVSSGESQTSSEGRNKPAAGMILNNLVLSNDYLLSVNVAKSTSEPRMFKLLARVQLCLFT